VDLDVDNPELAGPMLQRIFPNGLPPTRGWHNDGGKFHLLFLWEKRLARYWAIIKGELRDDGQVVGNRHYLGLEWRFGARRGDDKQYQRVIPPSLLPNGTVRHWNEHTEILPLPESVFADLEKYAPGPWAIHGNRQAQPAPRDVRTGDNRPDVETRAIAYLDRCDPAISRQRGHDQTFGVACRVGPGFDLEPETALRLIRAVYNPRCVPPWSEKELAHKVADAYRVETGRGWLKETNRPGWQAAPPAPFHQSNGKATQPAAEPICWLDLPG
jgi:hypothetical protein